MSENRILTNPDIDSLGKGDLINDFGFMQDYGREMEALLEAQDSKTARILEAEHQEKIKQIFAEIERIFLARDITSRPTYQALKSRWIKGE